MKIIIDYDWLKDQINEVSVKENSTITKLPIDPQDFDFDDLYDLIQDYNTGNI